jgi:hypothetical protein
MNPNSGFAKFLRFIGIALMGLTAAFTIMGGAGTTCVALNPTGYGDSFARIAEVQWLYILYVLVTVAIGVVGVWATVKLVKGMADSYMMSIYTLIAGIIIGAIHMATSRNLRGGSSMPVDMIVYVTIFTLIIFLLFRIPTIWQGVNFNKADRDQGNTNGLAAAITLILCGFSVLLIPIMMSDTHTIGSINYAATWPLQIGSIGSLLILDGIGWLIVALRKPIYKIAFAN